MVYIALPRLFMGSLQYSDENDTNHYFMVESHVLTFPKFVVRKKNRGSEQELYDEDARLFVKNMKIKNDARKDIIWYCNGYPRSCSLITGGRFTGGGFSESDKTVIIDNLYKWLAMLKRKGVTMPEGLEIPNEFETGNPYMIDA